MNRRCCFQSQKYSKGDLSFTYRFNNKEYQLNRAIVEGSKAGTVSEKTSPTTHPDISPDAHYKDLEDMFRKSFVRSKVIAPILSLYVISTYCYEVFDQLPILWIQYPRWGDPYAIEQYLAQLSFRGRIFAQYPSKTELDDDYRKQYSIILSQDSGRLPLHRMRPLSRFFHLNAPDSSSPSIRPWVILSPQTCPPALKRYTINLPFYDFAPWNPLDEETLMAIKRDIACFLVKKIETLETVPEECEDPYLEPLYSIINTLYISGALKKARAEKLYETLSKLAIYNQPQLDPEQEILASVNHYLEANTEDARDGMYPVHEIRSFLHFHSEYAFGINGKSVSQLLGKYHLIIDRKRIRSKTEDKRPTYIAIHQTRLKGLIS